jgi:hypothetical protein
MNDRVLGHRLFVDGVTRAVYLDAAGNRQGRAMYQLAGRGATFFT